MALRQSDLLVNGTAYGAHRSVANHRQPRADIHPLHETGIGFAAAGAAPRAATGDQIDRPSRLGCGHDATTTVSVALIYRFRRLG